ncbi:M1 family metallopeptidase [Pseudanabaena sp. FACHB-2040]|uniref:M1 family metallopeptidase n=1 Tax=Pseudanabaena sp. FACHB-2040 TaxID=2692859 RepID=UPI0016839395|nr:M1 family metallopeptidase [Pseudanabaena sp. FACHB-2040]MBD2260986.1 M1 family metallopeptidase [Pseudanabaena sp. FACHB-2040]
MLNAHRLDTDNNSHKSFELPGARPHYNPDRPGQVEHIALDLALDLDNQVCEGTCTVQINPVRDGVKRLTLDAVSLQIQAVTVGTVPQDFDYDGEQLHIRLQQPTQAGEVLTLQIAYRAEQPQRGIYFIGPDQHYPNRPIQVWTQGEDEDSRFWFPCFDYPGQLATSEIRVRVPQQYQTISNGELVETVEEGAFKIYHWVQKQIHPTYLMALAVGDFDVIQDQWQGIPVTYYVEKGRKDEAQRTMGKTPQMIEFFSEKYGYTYAFPKYAQVCAADFIFGGMENTSCTILTDRCLLDERAALDNRNSESLVAHELAHQWFGDLLVINHWSHAWVKEGMATYSEVMWTEREYGDQEAAYYRLEAMRSYLSEDRSRYRRPMVTHVYREAIELYDRHIYEKGACVYHMIRTELGDDLFWRAIHTFVQTHAHQTVETIDLIRAIERTTGRNLRSLFDQYVFRGGHPDYKVAYSWDGDSNLAKITITQTQVKDGDTSSTSGLFDLRIPIGFGYVESSGEQPQVEVTPFTVRVHEREQSFFFPLAKKPDFVSFDVGNHRLKTVNLEYPLAELKAQLQYDPDPLSRIEAAGAIAKKGSLEAVNALTTALKAEPFWGVRAEVAEQLASIKLDQAAAGLLAALQDPEANVRRAVVEALGDVKTAESYEALRAVVEQGDPSYYVEAAAIRALGKVGAADVEGKTQGPATVTLLESILKERSGWNEVVRSGAIGALSHFKTSEAALNLILQYTELGVPQALRLAAVRALGPISTSQSKANLERILDRLEVISREPFFLTQVSVLIALGAMETPRAMTVLQSLADHTADGRVRQRAEEAVQRVQKNIGKDQAVQKLQQEIDELKKNNQELKSRLEALEAKAKS